MTATATTSPPSSNTITRTIDPQQINNKKDSTTILSSFSVVNEHMNFTSDNYAGVHRAITEALCLNAEGRATAYGKSQIDLRIESIFNTIFERKVAVFFVGTGTAANALSMAYLNKPGGVIFGHKHCHMIEDECGAVEHITGGSRFYGVTGRYGKMDPQALNSAIRRYLPESVHGGQPMAVSMTQSTESGTVYQLDHIEEIANIAHAHGLPVHMDGARFANALVHLNCTPAEMTWKSGVDILSFGATKNGCWCAEAIVVFNDVDRALRDMSFLRKRAAHLFSKTRFIAAQFEAYFYDNLWLKLANDANMMAKRLVERIFSTSQRHKHQTQSSMDKVNPSIDNINVMASEVIKKRKMKKLITPRLAWPVETNEVFVIMDRHRASELQGASGIFFYEWNVPDDNGDTSGVGYDKGIVGEQSAMLDESSEGLYRLVTSFATTEVEVDTFAEMLLARCSSDCEEDEEMKENANGNEEELFRKNNY